jgi:hypothetical protein
VVRLVADASTRRLATLGALPTRRDVGADSSEDRLAAAYLTRKLGVQFAQGRDRDYALVALSAAERPLEAGANRVARVQGR